MKVQTFFKPVICLVQHNSSTLAIDTQIDDPRMLDSILYTLIKKNGIVIWENQGRFKLIILHIIQNALETYKISQQLKYEYPRTAGSAILNKITWEQGIDVSSEAVKELLSIPTDSSDDPGDSDAPTDTAGKDQTKKPQSNTG